MGEFDPFTQNATLLGPDGKTPIPIPVTVIDAFNVESISIGINYGAQIGATFLMLLAVLILTPSSKFRRSSNLLHLTCLTICLIRNVLIVIFYTSPFNDFYPVWAQDFRHVERHVYDVSLVANTFSLLLTISVEAALMNQAWSMVMLWPDVAKWTLSAVSAVVTMLTVGFKIGFTVVQNEGVLGRVPPRKYFWIIQASIITNILSISWFCAIFNAKLIHHLITNRGLLPSNRALTPMEILIMTNGVLMVFPVIFSSLEWAHVPNFEPGSLALTTVTILLPLGTLAAQRMARSHNISHSSGNSSNRGRLYLTGSAAPLKGTSSSFATTSGGGSSRGTAMLSRTDAAYGCGNGNGFSAVRSVDTMEPVVMELGHIDDSLYERSGRSASLGGSV